MSELDGFKRFLYGTALAVSLCLLKGDNIDKKEKDVKRETRDLYQEAQNTSANVDGVLDTTGLYLEGGYPPEKEDLIFSALKKQLEVFQEEVLNKLKGGSLDVEALGNDFESAFFAGEISDEHKAGLMFEFASFLLEEVLEEVEDVQWRKLIFGYLIKATELSKDPSLLSEYLNGLANYYKSIGDEGRALISYMERVKILEKENIQDGLGRTYENIAGIYIDLHERDKSVKSYLERALENSKEALNIYQNGGGDNVDAGYANLQIATIYKLMEDYDKAKVYFKEALRALEGSNSEYIAHNNYAELLFKLGEYKSAMSLYRNAYKLLKDAGIDGLDDMRRLVIIIDNIIRCYLHYLPADLNDFSIELEKEQEKLRDEIDRLASKEVTEEALAKHKTEKAEREKEKADAENQWLTAFLALGGLVIAGIGGLWRQTVARKKVISKQKDELGVTLTELREQKELVEITNSALKKTNLKLEKLSKELESKNAELVSMNETLNQTVEELRVITEDLEAQRKLIEEQKKKLEKTHEKLVKHEAVLNGKNEELKATNEALTEQQAEVEKANELLEEQKKKLEVANTELNEAMKAAGAIQEIAIKNYINKFEKFLPKSFVYWNKKDALSGDFFHARVKDGKIIILSADATGHGISGGLLGTYIDARFEDLLKRNGVLDPSVYMDKLREYVVSYFKNSEKEEEGTFGSEASCCVYDPETRVLKFTGAMHQMFLLKKGSEDVLEIKGDRSGLKNIGSEHIDLASFSTITMQLDPGDRVFFASDGYWDQFGGNTGDGKKMTRKRFRSKLVNSRDKSMQEVSAYLSEEFDTWKDGREHLDDVLVVGFEAE